MSLFCDRCMNGQYHVIWTGPYHVIVPATEMTGKVLRKMTINHKYNRRFSFLFKGYVFFVVALKKHGYIADLL